MDPELAALQHAIQVLHQLMTVIGDPAAVATIGKCLQALTGLQQTMMQQAQQGGPQGAQQPQGGQPALTKVRTRSRWRSHSGSLSRAAGSRRRGTRCRC